jgi:hypothetical protein
MLLNALVGSYSYFILPKLDNRLVSGLESEPMLKAVIPPLAGLPMPNAVVPLLEKLPPVLTGDGLEGELTRLGSAVPGSVAAMGLRLKFNAAVLRGSGKGLYVIGAMGSVDNYFKCSRGSSSNNYFLLI